MISPERKRQLRAERYRARENATAALRRARRCAAGICLDCPATTERTRCEACRLRLKATNIAYLDRKEARRAA